MNQKPTLRGLATAACLFAGAALAAQPVTLPNAASPAARASQTIGISTVEVSYSRPSVKGRAIWGELVPFGWNAQAFGNGAMAPWRAGANENTTLTLSHEAKVAGQPVPAGTYGLFFTINADGSGEAILSKDHRSWGSFFYDASHDQLRAKITTRAIAHTELLTYDFINLTKNSAELVLNWEKKQFPLPIEFDVADIVLANADEELKGPTGFGWQGNQSAAQFALDNGTGQEKAVKWADRAIQQNKNFRTLRTKAGLLKQTGKAAEADKLMAEATEIANEAELNQYGYELIGEKKMEEAIKIMALNTDRHPASANAWDSLGEANALKGDKPAAIKAFKKSLSLDPPQNVRNNSEKYLKELGAL